jgi:hypothetical protein
MTANPPPVTSAPTGRAGWRPLPGKGPEPAQLGQVLDWTLRSLGTPSVAGVEVIFERWDEVVGVAMAGRTAPLRLDGDALIVSCDEPAIATHVRFLQAELVERLRQLSGDRRVARIEVRVAASRRGPRPPRGGARRPPR